MNIRDQITKKQEVKSPEQQALHEVISALAEICVHEYFLNTNEGNEDDLR